jgi:hypothetical protein
VTRRIKKAEVTESKRIEDICDLFRIENSIRISHLTVVVMIFESPNIARFVRNFSLPLLLFGDVRRGRLQQGQIYPS